MEEEEEVASRHQPTATRVQRFNQIQALGAVRLLLKVSTRGKELPNLHHHFDQSSYGIHTLY